MKKLLLSLVFSLLFIFFSFNALYAASSSKGVTVSPSIAHIDLATEPADYEITYTNNYDSDIKLKLSAKDFTELEDGYKPEFLDNAQSDNYKYSLSSWISFENANLELSPHESKTVKVFIDKNRITKGGHYASILAEISQPETKKDINIKAILSSLLFVRASTGKEIEEGKVSTLDASRDGIEFPKTFLLRFQNSGNVHVIPYGLLQIFDPLGHEVARGILNEDSLDALPESIRTYKIPVKSTGKVLIPGSYTAKLGVHFGKTNQKLTATTKFFSQGSFDFLKIGAAFILILIILAFYSKTRKKVNKKD